jgi:hypothetical protein
MRNPCLCAIGAVLASTCHAINQPLLADWTKGDSKKSFNVLVDIEKDTFILTPLLQLAPLSPEAIPKEEFLKSRRMFMFLQKCALIDHKIVINSKLGQDAETLELSVSKDGNDYELYAYRADTEQHYAGLVLGAKYGPNIEEYAPFHGGDRKLRWILDATDELQATDMQERKQYLPYCKSSLVIFFGSPRLCNADLPISNFAAFE